MVNLAFCELTGLSLLLTKFELLPFGIHLMDSYKIYVIGILKVSSLKIPFGIC